MESTTVETKRAKGKMGLDEYRVWRTRVRRANTQIDPFREVYVRINKQYVGTHYGDATNGSDTPVPVDWIRLAVNIHRRVLIAQGPQAYITHDNPDMKAAADDCQHAVNLQLLKMKIGAPLKGTALAALLSPLGVVHVGLDGGSEAPNPGEPVDPGELYCERIALEDLFFDMDAKSWAEIEFIGYWFDMPLDEARERWGKGVEADTPRASDEDGAAPATQISRGTDTQNAPERVALGYLWLRKENKSIIFPRYGGQNDAPLEEKPYKGPQGGGFHFLGFWDVLDQLMPLPPASTWINLHDVGNNLYTKLARQAQNAKQVGVFAGADLADAQRVNDAKDGETVHAKAGAIENEKIGAVDQVCFAFFIQAKNLFYELAGNLGLLGGLGPQSPTATQDEMLAGTASAQLDDMKSTFTAFVAGVMRDVAWWVWTDPTAEVKFYKTVKGAPGISIPVTWGPEQRKGDFEEYRVSVVPFSMDEDTPKQRMARLRRFVQQDMIPLAGLMQAAGLRFNLKAYLADVADLEHLPQVEKYVIEAQGGPGQEAEAQGGMDGGRYQPTMPRNTTRTEVRVGRPGAPQQTQDALMMQTLLGGKLNADQAPQMGM